MFVRRSLDPCDNVQKFLPRNLIAPALRCLINLAARELVEIGETT
jgi:hypothetical protein